ncbi:MAG: hypothetical protein ACK5IC_11555 [Moheibacter sp.]
MENKFPEYTPQDFDFNEDNQFPEYGEEHDFLEFPNDEIPDYADQELDSEDNEFDYSILDLYAPVENPEFFDDDSKTFPEFKPRDPKLAKNSPNFLPKGIEEALYTPIKILKLDFPDNGYWITFQNKKYKYFSEWDEKAAFAFATTLHEMFDAGYTMGLHQGIYSPDDAKSELRMRKQ